MPVISIIERAASLTWRHRTLWILGLVLAFTSGSWSSGFQAGAGNGDGSSENGFLADFGPEIFLVLAVVCCLVLLGALIAVVVSHVTRAGLYRVLDDLIVSEVPPSVRGALREGWHRRTWRLFFINLVVGLGILVVVITTIVAMFVVGFATFGVAEGVGDGPAISALVAAVCGFVLALTVLLGIAQVFSALWGREAVVADRSFAESFEGAVELIRDHTGDLVKLFIAMVVVGIAFTIGVLLLLLLLAAFVGLPSWAIYRGVDSILPALIWAIPTGILAAVVIAAVTGYYTAFVETVWSLAYRYLRPAPAPELGGPLVPPYQTHQPAQSGGHEHA